MTDESAAGRKTDKAAAANRNEQLAAALEKQFHTACAQTEGWLRTYANPKGVIFSDRLPGLVKLMQVNTQLAGMILRIDAAKNRNSKTQ